MSWQIWGILIAILILAFAIFRKSYKGGHKLFKISPIKHKIIQFATPHRKELMLLMLYVVAFLWSDVLQNKIFDKGLDYRVTWFGSITSNAYDMFFVMFFIFHIILVSLFVLSLQSKATNRTYDLIMGTIALFGVGILMGAFFQQMHSNTVRFLWINMGTLDMWHIGVSITMLYALYLSLTK